MLSHGRPLQTSMPTRFLQRPRQPFSRACHPVPTHTSGHGHSFANNGAMRSPFTMRACALYQPSACMHACHECMGTDLLVPGQTLLLRKTVLVAGRVLPVLRDMRTCRMPGLRDERSIKPSRPWLEPLRDPSRVDSRESSIEDVRFTPFLQHQSEISFFIQNQQERGSRPRCACTLSIRN